MKVGFIGLGKLGLPCAEAMAVKYSVTGFDIEDRASDNIKVVTDVKDAVENKDQVVARIRDYMENYTKFLPAIHTQVKRLETEFFSGEALYKHIRESI
jgi:UDP-N-acetyl-D-mannosaminuronate dehydrogenase